MTQSGGHGFKPGQSHHALYDGHIIRHGRKLFETTPKVETPRAWAIQSGSTLGFSTAWSGQPIEGLFKRWDGDILFSPGALSRSKLTIRVDLASVTTGDDQRDATLPTSDWFDATTHPTGDFTASRFKANGRRPIRFLPRRS